MKLLKVLYNLLLIDAVPTKQLTCEKVGGQHSTELNTDRRSFGNDYVDVSMDQGNDESKEDAAGEVFLGYMDDENQLTHRFGYTDKASERPPNLQLSVIREEEPPSMSIKAQDTTLKNMLPQRANRMTRRGSIDMNEIERKQKNIDNALGSKGYTTAEMELL